MEDAVTARIDEINGVVGGVTRRWTDHDGTLWFEGPRGAAVMTADGERRSAVLVPDGDYTKAVRSLRIWLGEERAALVG